MRPDFALLNVDKPAGMTSHDVVAVVRRESGIKKVGHAGTLDPMATGVLVLCLGQATRLSQYVMGHEKTYLARVQLGVTTDTYDAEGQITASNPTPIDKAQVQTILPNFRGDIQQIPPMVSAIKKGGKKLYELARQGKEVEREARSVSISILELQDWDFPYFSLLVRCSSGTYIRSLAHDIGQMLAVGAHLVGLRRLAIGKQFRADEAVPLDELRAALKQNKWEQYRLPPDAALGDMPAVHLDAAQSVSVQNGGFILLDSPFEAEMLRAYNEAGEFFALLEARDAHWKPARVFR
jgi:tRNA pseudouridine55 synthase